MRRKGSPVVKKSLAVLTAAAVMMSHGVTVFADEATNEIVSDTTDQYPDNDTVERHGNVDIDDSSGFAFGIDAFSRDGDTAKVTVDGGVTVIERGEKDTENGTEIVTSGTAVGILSVSDGTGSGIDVKVQGDVKAESKNDNKTGTAQGNTNYLTNGAGAEIKIGRNLDVKSDNEALGITVVGGYDTSFKAAVDGDITVKSEDGDATGSLNYLSDGSSAEITIGGDINVNAGNTAYGINVQGEENTVFKSKADGGISVESSGMSSRGLNIQTAGKASAAVGEDITSDGFGIMAAAFNDKENEISISVGGDVKAGLNAVVIVKGEDSIINLSVDGTIKGENQNIVFTPDNGGTVTTKGVDITVWKIDTEKTNGMTATVFDSESGKYGDYSEKAAEVINYIIKVDDTSKLTPDTNTAKEGQQVFLEVNVPSGYSIDSFYTAEGGTDVNVLKDSSGKYYLVVPRGGGVYVGVSLKANSNPDPKHDSSSDDDHRPGPTDSDDSGNGGNSNNNKPGFPDGIGPGSPDNLGGKVNVGQNVRVGGQEVNANVIVKDAGEAVKNTFGATLSMAALTGLLDFGGGLVVAPADATIKESFTVSVEGIDGIVTAYFDLADYKAGDIILCSYMDASGAMVVFAVTPDMINGTSLLLTIPANCTLALAGSSN